MSLQNFDFLSPSISLYFNNKRTHTSQISGIIVIILLFCCFGYSFIILFSTIKHSNVTSLIYKKFGWETGLFHMNNTQLFHFFQIFSSENGGYFDKYDSKYIRIYTTYAHNSLEQSQLHNYDHWVFGECREGIDNKDLNKDLFENIDNFTNAACMRYYYNSKRNEYYSTDDKEFIWPHLEHGISRRDNVFLTTLIEKCSNDSVLTNILGNCAPIESIEEYVKKYFGIYMYLLDNSIDPTNYSNPIQSYFQVISTAIGNSQTFVDNYLFFSPVIMRTKVGELFGKYTDINSFFFDYNRKGIAESFNRILLKNYYLMQNNFNIYERRYNGINDILSKIGGTSQLFFYIFFILNYIYNHYIVVMDTNNFFCKIEKASQEENSIDAKDTNYNNKTINSFKQFKINIIGNEPHSKPLKKKMYSLNFNIQNNFDSKSKGNKSEQNRNNKKNNLFNDNKEILKNNYFENAMNLSFNKNISKYLNKSNSSNDSFDYSNIKIKEINTLNKGKRVDTMQLLKEKNLNSEEINKNEIYSDLNDNITKKNDNDNDNMNKLNKNKKAPPRKKVVHFKESFKENKIKGNLNKNLSQTAKPTYKMSNLDEILNSPKLNRKMVNKSKYFQKEFSFSFYLLCFCLKYKRKEEFENLSLLIQFRKKILSENFIFHQHIINLLLIQKCGINPSEIKYLM